MTCIPAALNGFVDIAEDGTIRLRKSTTPPGAVLVIPEGKYAAWKALFPSGLDKALESKYRTSRRLWFSMTDIPADAPEGSRIITPEGVSVFWSGFPVPIDTGEWLGDPPETLPEVSYADIMRLLGVSVATGPADALPMQEPEPQPPEEMTTEPAPPAPEPEVPFDDISDVVSGKGTQPEPVPALTDTTQQKEKTKLKVPKEQTALKVKEAPPALSTAADTDHSTAPAAETADPFDGSQIPQILRNMDQWLLWEKPGKIPINPKTYMRTKAPEANWSYEECRNAMPAGIRGSYGIGFSLKNGIFVVDFDHVLDERGQLKPEFAHFSEIVDEAGSYTEISPSGDGLHIIARCDDIPGECNRTRLGENVELYCHDRYFTVTGKAWKNPGVLRTITGDEYRDIYYKLGGDHTQQRAPTRKVSPNTAGSAQEPLPMKRTEPARSDDEVYYRVTSIPKYKALWEGNTTGYPSPSEADYALMCILAEVTGCNIEQMIRVFMKSGLAKREKVLTRLDYVRITAVNAAKEWQSQPQNPTAPAAGTPAAGRTSFGWGGNNWQAEATHQTCKNSAGKLTDIRRAGEGIYAVIDPNDNIVKLVSSGRDDVFHRWCNTHYEDFGYDPKFAEEMFRNISVLHTADPIPGINIRKPITAIPCLDGYISVKTLKRCDPPAEMEYCPWMLHLNVEDAEYNPDYQPTGRVLTDLSAYVGESTTMYLLSVAAASIMDIPANRRVVIFTGPPRSFKTTTGMVLGELGIAPPSSVDFSTEINGKGKYRPELSKHISQFPMLFVNDPQEPDGTAVKKLCDETQQYERKHVNQVSVYQRSTVVLTMNHPPVFKTSGMDNKTFFVNSVRSYIDEEIPLSKYMDEIHSDGSLKDVWQAMLRIGIKQHFTITIPDECRDHNLRMQIGAAPLQKWLSMCRPAPQTDENFHETKEVYENYMVYVNPYADPSEIREKLEKKKKSASWKPNAAKDGIEGESKTVVFRHLEAQNIQRARIRANNQRGFYIQLPIISEWGNESGTPSPETETERVKNTPAEVWNQWFGKSMQKMLV